jgi:release factor glutamine methyltransferase
MRLADWHGPDWREGLGAFDLVIANPPYVETSFALAPSVCDYEPLGALYAGPEGLDDYRVLVPQLPALLRPDGVAVLEIGATQAEAVTAIARAAGFAGDVRHDLGGRARALILRLGLV